MHCTDFDTAKIFIPINVNTVMGNMYSATQHYAGSNPTGPKHTTFHSSNKSAFSVKDEALKAQPGLKPLATFLSQMLTLIQNFKITIKFDLALLGFK